jgi:hypothetical protein
MKLETKNSNKIEYGIVKTYQKWFMVLCKKAILPMLCGLIRCKLLISLHLNTFERLCILGWSHSNHNYKVFIAFHLGLHIEQNGPHTPCSHAKKLKNGARG